MVKIQRMAEPLVFRWREVSHSLVTGIIRPMMSAKEKDVKKQGIKQLRIINSIRVKN